MFKIIRLIMFLIVLCLYVVLANIEKEYYLIYKKLEYLKGIYGNINKYANLNYEYQGVSNNYRLYVDNTNNEQELILWNLDENWEINRIKVNKRVQEFWGYVNNYGIFVIYKRSNDIYWKIYKTNTGQEIIGGFLTSEDVLNLKLKDTYFASYKQGAFCSLVFYDNLGTQKYQIYYIDIWGRHDLVTQK
ncbi:MAG: hypothetical protein RMJ36_05675 [Candidatus Calescibacterium sp.]|nr:hypothetical protein [Candidatus Calescibacterium sp.]MDW8133125.1 hypothetical protein [Candidatus Calescibacterium sp.]